MTITMLFVYFVAGILLSVLVPVGAKWVREATSSIAKDSYMNRVQAFAIPILKVAFGSAVLGALLVLIFTGSGGSIADVTPASAMLYGYGWDATLQKIRESVKK